MLDIDCRFGHQSFENLQRMRFYLQHQHFHHEFKLEKCRKVLEMAFASLFFILRNENGGFSDAYAWNINFLKNVFSILIFLEGEGV